MAKTPAQKLCELVDKKYLVFTSRGNNSIKLSLEVLKLRKKHSKVLIQDQGGWLTYPEFIEKLKFEKVELKTDYGLINPKDLEAHKGAVLLVNSMPAYAFLEDMEFIYEKCMENKIFVINDVSGSIGTDEAKYGDVIIGSFGNAKPIDLGEGGFIATNCELLYREFCELNDFKPDVQCLDSLDVRIHMLDDTLMQFDIVHFQVIEDLSLFHIIHPDNRGINVIVKFNNDEEKNEILEYCKISELEHTICPRYIRVNCPAVSIEIKRLKTEPVEEIKVDYDKTDEDKFKDDNLEQDETDDEVR